VKLFFTTFVLVLMVVVPFDSAFPQAGAKEGLQKDGESSPQKRPMETRSRNPFLFPRAFIFSPKGRGSPLRERN